MLRTITSRVPVVLRRFHGRGSSPMGTGRKVALVLAGCGVYDGAEITEAVAAITALSRQGADFEMFAPNIEAMHTVNHMTGEEMDAPRNVLVESARIARGAIKDLAELKVEDVDAIIFPGGFGVAKNLSNFAVAGAEMEVNKQIKEVIQKAHAEEKVLGFACIAPVLSTVLPKVQVTVGSETEEAGGYTWPSSGAAHAISAMGGRHVHIENPVGVVWDAEARVASTPAYMCDAQPHQVLDGITKMVEIVLEEA